MDVLLVSRKNGLVEQSGKGKSVQFGIGVRKCTHMHVTSGSRTQWLGYIKPAAQQGCNAATLCYCQRMLHHFTVITTECHLSDMKLYLQTSIYLGYVDKKSEWFIVIYHMLCLL